MPRLTLRHALDSARTHINPTRKRGFSHSAARTCGTLASASGWYGTDLQVSGQRTRQSSIFEIVPVDQPRDTHKSNFYNEIQPELPLRTDRVDQACPKYKSNCYNEMLLGALPRTGCIDYSCVTRKSNCCKEIAQRPPLRTGCIDYTCVTRKSNSCREILPRPAPRTGCIDYSCVTRKSNCCKEIRQIPLPRTGCIDYSCVTRKSNCCKEMNVSGAVPVIPVSHVSFIAPMTYAEMKFSRPTQVFALSATRGRRGRRMSFAVKSGVSSSQPRHQCCFAPRQNTAGIRRRTRVRSLPRSPFAGAKGDFTPIPSSRYPQSTDSEPCPRSRPDEMKSWADNELPSSLRPGSSASTRCWISPVRAQPTRRGFG